MRAWLGWVAAVLLIALAFAGGPEAIDVSPAAAQTTMSAGELTEKRDAQVHDGGDVGHRLADRDAPTRPRLLALPPSAQTTMPVPVKGMTFAAPPAAPRTTRERGPLPHLGARTPEALQIFRC